MSMLRKPAYLVVFLAFLFCTQAAWPQGLTGQIAGSVEDSSGAIVPGAGVALINTGTMQRRGTQTGANGEFLFTQLLPGSYTITVSRAGFKTQSITGIELTATERVVVRAIRLDLGEMAQSVSVQAEAARLQTQSAERSGLISTAQFEQLSLKGRDYLGLIQILPGVVDTKNREAPGWNNLAGININGNRAGTINLTLDGISSLDTGSMGGPYIAPSVDAVAEVKVLLTNYQAEYGRSSGGAINAVIKSGTKEFHGTAYYFLRNEALNANEFFRNRDGLDRPRYRYQYPGYNIGGPIYVPGKLNSNKDKIFFFWSQEFLPRKTPTPRGQLTFPTALERTGDFSGSLDTNGRLITVKDPLNNKAPFPGNLVPAPRIDKDGQGLLNVFPLPNYQDPANSFNTVFQSTTEQPRQEQLLRVDWNVTSRTLFYARGLLSREEFKGDYSFVLASSIWPQFPIRYAVGGRGLVSTMIHTFSPNLVNEFTFGVNRGVQQVSPLNQAGLDRNSKVALGLNLPQRHPEINPLSLIPNASFAGIANPPQLSIESRFPFFGTNNIWNWSDNLSWTKGAHSLKFGVYIENTSRNTALVSAFNGTYDFSRNVNNPMDSNHPFANALLGSVNSYTEADKHPHAHARYVNVEWYAQDNWRVSRRLSIDAGLRFYWIQPTRGEGDLLANFEIDSYDLQRAPLLVEPYRQTPSGPRVARNPATGEILPAVKIGSLADGSGEFYHGMVKYNERVMNTPPVQFGPRLGFAWDVFGDGKTAVRGGAGFFYDRVSDAEVTRLGQIPPQVRTSTANYTTIRALQQTPLSLSPANVFGVQQDYNPPAVYNWSFGAQRDIGWGVVADAAYVGNVGRRLIHVRNLNATPYGTNFLPSSKDPTLPSSPLPANFLRPIRGHADIRYVEFGSSSNYHSLQTQVQRRFGQDLTFGATWTWSKAMDLVDASGDVVNPLLDFRMRNYGKAGFDRLHNMRIYFAATLPSLSRKWNKRAVRVAGDGWQLSGIASFVSGAPTPFTYAFTAGTDITGATGAGVDSRVILTGDPNLPKSERAVSRHFRTEVVRPPEASNFGIGNAPKDPIRGPGVNNWDLSVFKNFNLGSERWRMQFRFETYNTFNHAQFNNLNTAARFDPQGKQVNARFGEYTSTSDARRVVLGIKLFY